jgi:hypothetical protein
LISARDDSQLADRFSLNKLAQGGNRYAYNVLSGNYRGHRYWRSIITTKPTRRIQRESVTHHHYFSFSFVAAKVFPELKISGRFRLKIASVWL